MCQATVYLSRNGQEEEIMRDVIQLVSAPEGVKLPTFFEQPRAVRARIERIDFLKHAVTLVPREEK